MYKIIIGLETHVQLNTNTKLFCSCLNEYTPDDPNKNICEFCTGQPGALPVLNKEAVNKAIQFGVAIGAKIPEVTSWDRKNYFYPDLPTGYQISQFDHPIVEGGLVPTIIENRENGQFELSSVEITRAHLEADAAKLIHAGDKTMVDFNRCASPLLEIVTEPCIHSREEAMAYVTSIQQLVRRINISEADMEKGQMRFDCNISLQNEHEQADNKLPNYRAEIKNINSIRFLGRVIDYEVKRQMQILERGEIPDQETRGWDDDKGVSTTQRSKEEAMDYRYFPEPDLLPVVIDKESIPRLSALPELPWTQRERYTSYGLSLQVASTLVANNNVAELFDHTKKFNKNIDQKVMDIAIANIILVNLLSKTEEGKKSVVDLISSQNLYDLAKLFVEEEINNKGLVKAIGILIEKPELEAKEIVATHGLMQVSDDSVLEVFVNTVIEGNPGPVEQYKAGKEQVIGFLVGQCMKESKGQGNPAKFKEILMSKLS